MVSMLRDKKRVTLVLGMAIVTAGCATLVKGRTQGVYFNSSPAGARVLINGEDRGTTPLSLELKRSKDYTVVIRKPGYRDVTVSVDKKFTFGWPVVGNFFSWDLLGLVVDVADGAAYQLTPEETTVILDAEKLSLNSPKDNETFRLAVFLKNELPRQPK